MRHEIHNGSSATLLGDVTWKKSVRSGAIGNCVELAWLDGEALAVRNSRFPTGPALVYTRAQLAAFLTGAKAGEFS
jgi:hypothetical protein